MNAKTCKRLRKLARMIAKEKQETTYQIVQLPLNTGKARRRWASKGYAPMVHVAPDCARGIYHQLKDSIA